MLTLALTLASLLSSLSSEPIASHGHPGRHWTFAPVTVTAETHAGRTRVSGWGRVWTGPRSRCALVAWSRCGSGRMSVR